MEEDPPLRLVRTSYKERTKRFRSTDDVTYIYDDEYDYKTRQISTDVDYQEYCRLWAEFIELLTVVRWRNKPDSTGDILRIKLEQDRTTDKAKITELIEYTQVHAQYWKSIEDKIDELANNKYVKRRNLTREQYENFKDYDMENYKRALYEMILK